METLKTEKRTWPTDRRSKDRVWWRRVWDKIRTINYYANNLNSTLILNEETFKEAIGDLIIIVKDKTSTITRLNYNVWQLLTHYRSQILQYIHSADFFIEKWYLTYQDLSVIIKRYSLFIELVLKLNVNEIINKLKNIDQKTKSEKCIKQIEYAFGITKQYIINQ